MLYLNRAVNEPNSFQLKIKDRFKQVIILNHLVISFKAHCPINMFHSKQTAEAKLQFLRFY